MKKTLIFLVTLIVQITCFGQANAGLDQSNCDGLFILDGSAPVNGTGTWSVSSGGATISNPTLYNTEVVIPQGETVLRWTTNDDFGNTYDEVSLTNGKFEISAGTNKSLCDNFVQLEAEPTGNDESGHWSVIEGHGNFESNSEYNTTVSNLAIGVNTFMWTVTKSNGCTDSDIVTVHRYTPPVSGFTTDISEGCSPLKVTFTNTSVGGATFLWDFDNGNYRADDDLLAFSDTFNAYEDDSTYTIRLIANSEQGCKDTTVKEIHVKGIPSVDFVVYPEYQVYPDATIYIDNLSNDELVGYYWIFGDGQNRVDYSYETGFAHVYNKWGNYEITLLASTGECTDSNARSITIQPPLPKDLGGRNVSGCEQLAFHLIANVDYTSAYHWEISSIDKGLIMVFDEEDPALVLESPGKYYAALSVADNTGNMFKIRTDTITVYPDPIAGFNFEPESPVGTNQTVQFENITEPGDFFTWDFGDGSKVSTDKNPSHIYTSDGTYKVVLRAYTENECYNFAEKHIEVSSSPLGFKALNEYEIKISPNPSNGKFFIEFENSTTLESVKINDINGHPIIDKKIESDKEFIDISSFGKGVYTVTLQGKFNQVKHKIIVLE